MIKLSTESPAQIPFEEGGPLFIDVEASSESDLKTLDQIHEAFMGPYDIEAGYVDSSTLRFVVKKPFSWQDEPITKS